MKQKKTAHIIAYGDWEITGGKNADKIKILDSEMNEVDSGSGSMNLTIQTSKNPSAYKRQSHIYIKDKRYFTDNNSNYETTLFIEQEGGKPYLKIEPNTVTLKAAKNSDSEKITIDTNYRSNDWYAQADKSWINIERKSDHIIISANADNPDINEREGSVTVTAKELKQEVTVIQQGKEATASISVSDESVNFGGVNLGKSEQQTITVKNTGDAVLKGSVSLTEETDTSYSVEGTSDYSINAGESKQYTVSFSPESEGKKSGMVIITHNGENQSSPIEIPLNGQGVTEPEISVDSDSLNLNSKNGEVKIEISNSGTGTLNWKTSTNSEWLTIKDGSSGTGNGTVTLSYNENTGTSNRSSVLTVESDNAINSPVEVTVIQQGKNTAASIFIDKEKIDFGKVSLGNSGEKNIIIENIGDAVLEGNVSYAEENDASYSVEEVGDYSINAGESKHYAVSFTPKSEGQNSGTVIITHNGENQSSPIEIPLSGQGVAEPEISVDPDSLNLESKSGEVKIEISNSGTGTLNWKTSTNSEWLTIKGGSSGTDNGTITLSYEENKQTDKRLSVITIESENAINSPIEVKVTQAGRDIPEVITVEYNSGWNLISIPVKEENLNLEDYFSSFDTERVYEFDGQYKRVSEFASGKGYWVKLNSAESVKYEGDLITEKTISLKKGWNLIGSTMDSLGIANGLKDPSGIIVDGKVWKAQFNNSTGEYELVVTDKILPGYGYFIKVKESGEIVLSK